MEGVAWFEIQRVDDDSFEMHSCIEICGNEQFYLGRDTDLCRYSWSDDLTISRQHLRVHCIIYEQHPDCLIAPLVYVTDLSSNGTYLKKSNMEFTASHSPGVLMGPNSTFLLDEGDELRMSESVTLVYRSMNDVKEVDFTPIQQRERDVFAARYLLTGRLLGEGSYGKVLIAVNQETQRQLACKVVKLNHLYKKLPVLNLRLPSGDGKPSGHNGPKRWPTRVATCFREFDILKDLSHPNIVTIEKVFWSHNTIFIFQELVTCGDLFSFLEYKGGRLNNIQSAVIIRQVLKAVEYLHDRNIVHRDIKPDNILMTSLEDGARVVLTDFGNARSLSSKDGAIGNAINKHQRMFSYVGTLEFAAPEIHRANKAIPAEEGYSRSVDMWSIGSVTATILSGDAIFTDRNHAKYDEDPLSVIIGLAAICDLSVIDESYHPVWSAVGERPKNFIKGLLVLEEEGRMTASQALAHPWFNNGSHTEDYENLYERSIQDWKPRQQNVKLIERISRPVPDFASMSSVHESVSRFFPPSQSDSTNNMLQKLSDTHRWRANTQLPSIMEDYQQNICASQVEPSSPVPNDDPGCQHNDLDEYNQYDSQAYRTGNKNDSEPPTLGNATAQGMSGTEGLTGDNDSHNSGESLNKVTTDYSQQGQLPIISEVQESILVDETPLSKQFRLQGGGDDAEEANDSYQQTQFPEEYRQIKGVRTGQDSVLVLETPPEVFKKRHQSSCEKLLSDLDSFDEGHRVHRAAMIVNEERGKRQKISHDYD